MPDPPSEEHNMRYDVFTKDLSIEDKDTYTTIGNGSALETSYTHWHPQGATGITITYQQRVSTNRFDDQELLIFEAPFSPSQPELSDTMKRQIIANSESGKASAAAAAALIDTGHVLAPEEMARLVSEGKGSRCAVVTQPTGAEVYIDGNKAGVAPLVFVLMKHDRPRSITLKLKGYKTIENEYTLDGNPIPIGITLEPEKSTAR